MSFFERHLTLWVLACMLAGVVLGRLAPGLVATVAAWQIGSVNLAVAVLTGLMIGPMLLKVDFTALGRLRQAKRGIGVTLAVNWLVKPFSMALFAWLFLREGFAPWLPAEHIDAYIAGLILLAAAPCTAMVFVWSHLVRGDALFTLTQVALNDLIMLFAFAPIVALLLGMTDVHVPWSALLASVLLYLVVPLLAAQALRARALRRGGPAALERLQATAHPVSVAALLATLVLLFAFQGDALLTQPLVVALLAVPILVQITVNALLAYLANRALGERHEVAGPSALIGASNFFELAVATAIALFGLDSPAALATVVGVLIEVPAMLAVVAWVNRSRGWYLAAARA
ncbi:MAG: arsenical-resistance protein [Gammaproteobacteria bacterium]|nr:MAG: arsenical-resistance protein [Gammaproteobacteria bacterium]